eukprot:2969021-Lingulodinium_polyedra.AAC.1
MGLSGVLGCVALAVVRGAVDASGAFGVDRVVMRWCCVWCGRVECADKRGWLVVRLSIGIFGR